MRRYAGWKADSQPADADGSSEETARQQRVPVRVFALTLRSFVHESSKTPPFVRADLCSRPISAHSQAVAGASKPVLR